MKVPAWSSSGEHCLLFCGLLIVVVFSHDREQGEIASSPVVPRTLMPFTRAPVSGPYGILNASYRSPYLIPLHGGGSVSTYKFLKFTNIQPTTNTLSNNYYFDFWKHCIKKFIRNILWIWGKILPLNFGGNYLSKSNT